MRAQGKSFILNQLLQVTGGFQIGSTTRPCTKGLWMWSSPQRRLDDAGKEYHIVSSRPADIHQLYITERQKMPTCFGLIQPHTMPLCTCNSSVAGCHELLLDNAGDFHIFQANHPSLVQCPVNSSTRAVLSNKPNTLTTCQQAYPAH